MDVTSASCIKLGFISTRGKALYGRAWRQVIVSPVNPSARTSSAGSIFFPFLLARLPGEARCSRAETRVQAAMAGKKTG